MFEKVRQAFKETNIGDLTGDDRPDTPKNDLVYTEKQMLEREEQAAIRAEDTILQNLRLSTLFEDEEEVGALGRAMPYVGVILSLITLILLVAK